MRTLKVGDIVKCKGTILGNDTGSEGIVYEEYAHKQLINKKEHVEHCVSVIFENGEYDGFTEDEQRACLERVEHCAQLANYKFKNVIQLSRDFHDGIFDIVFN